MSYADEDHDLMGWSNLGWKNWNVACSGGVYGHGPFAASRTVDIAAAIDLSDGLRCRTNVARRY